MVTHRYRIAEEELQIRVIINQVNKFKNESLSRQIQIKKERVKEKTVAFLLLDGCFMYIFCAHKG